MKLVFFGSMVNNAYIMCKALNKMGMRADFIREPDDHFIPHQPLWVDCAIEVPKQNLWLHSYKDCLEFDKEHQWNAPSWYKEILSDKIGSGTLVTQNQNKLLATLSKRRFSRSQYWDKVLGLLQEYDYIFACGTTAAILASLSGKPYSIWSYGADIRLLLNLEDTVSLLQPREFIYNKTTKLLLADAYKNARHVGFNYGENIYCAGGTKHSKKRYQNLSNTIIPFPAFYHFIKQPTATSITSLPRDKIKIFIPSRIDFFSKGHDKLLSALAKSKYLDNFHFICAGWGNDLEKFIATLSQNDLTKNVTVLDAMCSRPILHQYIQDSDLIIDQFNLGIYGSAALEAMSLAKPVMMYLDVRRAGHESPPPILNCHSESDIGDCLNRIANKQYDLKQLGESSQKWAMQYHGNDRFMEIIETLSYEN